MKQTEQHIAWIDHFLGDESTPQERAAFQAQLQEDPNLSADFVLVNHINNALSDQGIVALQNTLQQIDEEQAQEPYQLSAHTTVTPKKRLLEPSKNWLSALQNTYSRLSAKQIWAAASVIVLLFVFSFKSTLFYDSNSTPQNNTLADSSDYQRNTNYSTAKQQHKRLQQANPSSTIKIEEENGVLDNTPQLMATEIWLEKRCC